MAKLELNDVISELRDENNRLSNELLFANKCLLLFEKYRNHLNVLCINCKCGQNIDNKLKFHELEEEYNTIYSSVHNNNISIGNLSEINNEMNCEKDLTSKVINDLNCELIFNNNQIINSNHTNAKPRRNIKRKLMKDYDYKFGGFGAGFVCDSERKPRHRRIDSEERSYRCDWTDCTYETRDLKYLKHHRMRHTGYKPFKCKFPGCGAGFVCKSEVKGHQKRVHSEERAHRCEWPACNLAFKTSTYLRQHIRTHTGERPFVCEWPGCDLSFAQMQHLERHKLIHREIRNYGCTWPECDKRFRTNWSLKMHMMVHRGDRPYKCEWAECERAFTEKRNMLRHYDTHKNKLIKIDQNFASAIN